LNIGGSACVETEAGNIRQQEEAMVRSVQATLVAALLIAIPAIAWAEPKDTTPGAQMREEGVPPSKSEQKTQPGASEYAPGKIDTGAPGNSENAPGQSNSTTDPGNSENAPGQKK
jgi:hypothetical protein